MSYLVETNAFWSGRKLNTGKDVDIAIFDNDDQDLIIDKRYIIKSGNVIINNTGNYPFAANIVTFWLCYNTLFSMDL